MAGSSSKMFQAVILVVLVIAMAAQTEAKIGSKLWGKVGLWVGEQISWFISEIES